jgi:hypothetical protein
MSETGLHVTGVASREWGYNTRGELVSEDGPWTSFDRGYSFDGIGNRLRTAVNTTNTTTTTGADLGTYFASSGGAAGANPVNQYGQVALPGQAPVAVVHDFAINGKDAGFGHAENLTEGDDPVPRKSPSICIGKDYTESFTDPKGMAAHSWEEVYLPRLETSFPSDFPGKCP